MRPLLSFILFFISPFCFAQTEPTFNTQFYTTENGLPSNGIKGLEWDEANQFLWIATESGIVRFNGIDFKVFSKANLLGSNLERVASMVSNVENKIYAFDAENKIYSVKNHTITFDSIEGNGLLERISKTILPVTFDEKIVAKIKEVSKDFTLYHLTKIATDQSQSCWVLDAQKRLHYFPSKKSYSTYVTLLNKYKSLFKIDNQIFFVSINNLINKSESENNIIKSNIPIETENGQKIILPQNHKLFWSNGMDKPILLINNNAWLLHFENNKIIAKNICTVVPTNSLILFMQYYQKGKILFIGTESKGLISIKESALKSIKSNQASNVSRSAYYSQIALNENTIITNEGNLISDRTSPSIDNPIKSNFSFRISKTNDSLVWFSKLGSKEKQFNLFTLNTKTLQLKEYAKIILPQSASVCNFNGKNYISTLNGIGTIQNDSIGFLYRYKSPNPIKNETFDLTPYDANSFLLINCENVLKYNTTSNTIDTVFKSKGFCIRTLQKFGAYFFIGTYGGGFYILKNGIVKNMPLDKNKFLLYTHCFYFDEVGFCWLSTNRGLFKTNSLDLINGFEKNSNQIYYHYFGKNDGMDITELNGGCSPCAIQLNKETISFPTMDGLLWVNPLTTSTFLPQGKILIDNFIINGKKQIDLSNNIQLPANTKDILVQLAYSAWCNKENIYVDYKLDNNEVWQALDTKNESTIKLSNLPYGNYTLQIRKLNGFGENNYVFEKINFSIKTPWHKQWWFYLLIVSFFIGLFILFYKIRTRNLKHRQLKLELQIAQKTNELLEKNNVLEKSNDINTRLISIISHDIITPLKFLNVAGKNLLEKKELISEELKDETIKEITNTSKELQLLSTNILNWIKYQNENRRLLKEDFYLNEIVDQVFGILNSLANQKKLVLVNNIPSTLAINGYIEPLKILIYNLITNAINFSDKGRIIVDVAIAKKLKISVLDEGVGMTPEQIKNIMADQFIVSSANMDNKKGNGLGYLIIKDLIKMMDAKLYINSTKGIGTQVSIEIDNTF